MKYTLTIVQSLVIVGLVTVLGCAGARDTSQQAQQDTPSGEWITLFGGESLEGWTMTGPGSFSLESDGSMLSHDGMGLFYFDDQSFRDFELELDWMAATDSTNSGVFVRFPEPSDPWDAVESGYEIQIDDTQDPAHQTGAVYDFSAPFYLNSNPAGEWNTMQIRVVGQRYEIFLNGEKVNDFFGDRSREGFIGLQNHDPESQIAFRNIRIRQLAPAESHDSLADLFAVSEGAEPIRVLIMTTTHGFRHQSIETIHTLFPELEATTEFEFDLTEELSDLNSENLAGYDLLFFANSTLRVQGNMSGQDEISSSDRTYEFTLQTQNGPISGRIMLSGLDSDPSGSIQVGGGEPVAFDEITYSAPSLSFTYDAGQFGRLTAEGELSDTEFAGTLGNNDFTIELAGSRLTETTTAVADGVTSTQRDAVQEFLQSGKGIVVAHAGLDAFYEWQWYRDMVGGGLFDEHPWTQSVRVTIEDKDNPATQHYGDGFRIVDEIYVLDSNPRWTSRVLASLDMRSVGIEQGPASFESNDYPISWMREHDGGRVFATKLGHFADVWRTPDFLQHLLQGMRMAAGRIPADFSGHREHEVTSENVWPDDIAIDDRGNVWIAELRGEVHHYDAQSGETRQIAQVHTTDPTKIEHGLYGIEIDPDFYAGQPYVYLYYAEPETFINTLSRFEYADGRIDIDSEEVILRVPTEPNCCHQAGDLEWGPDGTLYLSTGDTGMSEVRPDWEMTEEEIQSFLDRNDLHDFHWSRLVDSERSAQNLQDLRGKILRINRDGSIPKDNPFYGEPGVRWEIYAYGLRNPYRFKVDGETGTLYIAVVGPDAAFDYDEYNISENGGENFGWPRSLGRLFYNEITPEHIPNFVPPMWEYTYETGGRSATVGPMYRHDGPGAFPEIFQHKLFIFDWSRRWIKWAGIDDGFFESDTANSVKNSPLGLRIPAKRLVDIKTFDLLTTTAPISMELAPDGSVYVAEFDGFWDAGPNARVTRYRWLNEPKQTNSSE